MKAARLFVCAFILCLPAVLRAQVPSIDGFINDAFWATQARVWVLNDPAHPEDYARCYLGYDDKWLYFAADVADGNVVGSNRTARSKAWEDDAVKLLLHFGDPDATAWTAQTVSFTFSAMGGATWTRGPLTGPVAADAEPGWPPTGETEMVHGVGLKPGTAPNVTGTRDAGYVIEARIPWSELGVWPPFKPGSTANLCILQLNRPEASMPGGKPLSTAASARDLTPDNPSAWNRIRLDWHGPLAVRGLVEPLPLYLGSADPACQQYQGRESDPQGPWLSREQWTAKLQGMRGQNLNTLVLRHTEPLRGLLAGAAESQLPDTRPAASAPAELGQAGWFSAEEFPRHREQFNWILAEAWSNGIRVYLSLDNSDAWSPPVPASQPASAPTVDAHASRQRIQQAMSQLFDTYPLLAGIAAGPGYNAAEMLEAVAEGLKVAASKAPASAPAGTQAAEVAPGHRPELLIWTDGVTPQQVRRLIDASDTVRLLCPLQGAQWFKPVVASSIAEFIRQVEGVPGVPARPVRGIALGSLRGASSHLFWADPNWARTLVQNVRNQGMEGFLLDVGHGEHGLGREAIADYAFNLGQQYSPQRWDSRLRMLGVGDYAGQLLELMQHASAIMPEILLLLHDDSGRYMPQFGMLLVQYLQQPSYRAGDDGELGERGRRIPEVPVAWPNAVWDADVRSIQSAVARVAQPDAVRTGEVINRLSRHVDFCKGILPALRHLEVKDADQARDFARLLDAIELNVMIGEHTVQKCNAALAWAKYKERRGRITDLMSPLRKSIDAWAKVAELGDRLYPEAVLYWQAQPVSAAPWSPEQIAASYRPVRGGWRDQVAAFQREFDILQQTTSTEGHAANLPLWDQVHAAPGEKRQTRFVFDFEKADPRYRLGEGASLSTAAEHRISGKGSLLIDTRQMPNKWHEVFVTDPGLVPVVGSQKYQVVVAYRVIAGATADAVGTGDPFEIGVRPAREYAPLGDHRTWNGPDGYTDVRILQVPSPAQDGNVLYIATRRPAAIVIDQVQIAQISD